jgi:hypothetical protein
MVQIIGGVSTASSYDIRLSQSITCSGFGNDGEGQERRKENMKEKKKM